MRPLIGIPTSNEMDANKRWRFYSPRYYADAVLEAGGLPLLIPLNVLQANDEDALRTVYQRLDGILLSGGGDVHPEFYRQYISERIYRVDRNRDEVEIKLAQWAYNDDRPLLGICRGNQVVNVALGGTLIHDIPSTIAGTLRHDQDDAEDPSRLVHQIQIDPESRLATILQEKVMCVNSLHHQAVDQLAPPLKVNATSDDGVIEGIEDDDAHFYMGVQWHPEQIRSNVPSMKRLFATFVEACTVKTRGKLSTP